MKQETINIIKSMTEQGFLVIVDPEKLNNEDRVIIQVMAWKDGDNKAEATLTAEEQKPEIDLLQCDGRRFRAKIQGVECEGVVSIDALGSVYLCQNKKEGNYACDLKGFVFSWLVKEPGSDANLSIYGVTDFELIPEPRVIFTNCVGEVFTEEDKKNNVTVFWASFKPLEIRQGNVNRIRVYSKLDKTTTDIFRSKKSLLKYLYETCE